MTKRFVTPKIAAVTLYPAHFTLGKLYKIEISDIGRMYYKTNMGTKINANDYNKEDRYTTIAYHSNKVGGELIAGL